MDRGALRSFLSAHMDLKRIVVSHLGEQPVKRKGQDDVDLTYTWGKTAKSVRAAISGLPRHAHNAMMDAVKKMVITFDILKPSELNNIETDDEITANANGLIAMYDYIIERRSAKS